MGPLAKRHGFPDRELLALIETQPSTDVGNIGPSVDLRVAIDALD